MKLRLLLAMLLLPLASVSSANSPSPTTLAEIDEIFADWRLSAHAPGVVYGIVLGGKLVRIKGLGVQDLEVNRAVSSDSRFRIASMSKAFTALAILKLRDEGKLSLEAPAETYVPEMKQWRYPTSDSPKITVRNLLTHTSGFVEDNPWGDRQQDLPEAEFTAMLQSGVPFARSPGLAMEYSNFGYATLGRIITNVSGMPYQDYIHGQIMVPLGMTSTGFEVLASPQAERALGYRWQNSLWTREPDMKDGAFGAMGGIETTASDYAKWVSFLLSAWPARSEPETGPVRRSTVREIVTGANFIETSSRNETLGAGCRVPTVYAMGWVIADDCDLGRVVRHSGGYPGYGSIVMLLPDRDVGIFAFSNRTYGSPALPAYRAAMVLNKSGLLQERLLSVTPGLADAYEAARAVWITGKIKSAPLANNVLMDRNASEWQKLIGDLKSEVGSCDTSAPIRPLSAMEGRFAWDCEHGRISGRVQRAPTDAVALQALQFASVSP